MRWLQKGAMALLVIALSSVIFFVLISDKQTRKSVLRPTLEALGEQLFAAVRDDSQKELLEANYKAFVRNVEEQEIDPEEVENVAATILNLSSRDSVISSREAMLLLPEMAIDMAADGVRADAEKKYRRAKERSPSRTGFSVRPLPPSWSKVELAERLKSMQEFQRQMDLFSRESALKEKLQKKYHFQPSDSGLQVFVDVRVRDVLTPRDSLLLRKLRELEKKQWLKWGHSSMPPLPLMIKANGPSAGHAEDPGSAHIEFGFGDSSSVDVMVVARDMAIWGQEMARIFADSSVRRQIDQAAKEQAAKEKVRRSHFRDAVPPPPDAEPQLGPIQQQEPAAQLKPEPERHS